jgi:hypothetical protein
MTVSFRDHIGCFVYVYLDDIFVYSNTLEEHELHLWIVFELLEVAEFFLEQEKCNLHIHRETQLFRSCYRPERRSCRKRQNVLNPPLEDSKVPEQS